MVNFMDADDHRPADAFVRRLLEEYKRQGWLCSISASLYSTAWVSMVSKPVNGRSEWLFPASFQYICDHQQNNGGWEGIDVVDEIVNSLACLLSLKRHDKIEGGPSDLADRAAKAILFLNERFLEWDIAKTERIAFEVLVPRILHLLEEENIRFQFPGREALLKVKEAKMSKFSHGKLYERSSPMLYSLEAFIGMIDFDKMKSHLSNGSLFNSPAATAAYLMNISDWDERAELYLKNAVQNGRRNGDGAVACTYPSTSFEFSWPLCNILENGLQVDSGLGAEIATILEHFLSAGKGLAGWGSSLRFSFLITDPSVPPNADDTSKVLVALALLSRTRQITPLIEKHEKEKHFTCFEFERNPSFSTNCHVLLAFVQHPKPTVYLSQIKKCVRFICDQWCNADAPLTDKWNLSVYYPSLLASQALIRTLRLFDAGRLELNDGPLVSKIVLVLFQVLSQILHQQSSAGSWGPFGSREETAYAIIALTYVASLPILEPIWPQIENAIRRGRDYLISTNALENRKLAKSDLIWAAQTSYGLENICHSYVLAAMHAPLPHCILGSRVGQLVNVAPHRVENFKKLHVRLPFFRGIDDWMITAWVIEGNLFIPELENRLFNAFGQKCAALEAYFAYLPFSWTVSNGLADIAMGAHSLLDMMMMAGFIFYIDELFERDLASTDVPTAIRPLLECIDNIFLQPRVDSHGNRLVEAETGGEDGHTVYERLAKFVQYILSLPKIQNASENDKALLESELKAYLIANSQQLRDNFRLKNQEKTRVIASPPSPYIKWVKNTGTEHFGGYCFFPLIICLLGNGEDFLPNTEIKYIAQDCARRASVVMRMFNDKGSMSRDRRESNLNSVFFPEFVGETKNDHELGTELVRLGNYEKRCLLVSLKELENACGNRFRHVYKALKTYNNVCEYFADMYKMKKDLL